MKRRTLLKAACGAVLAAVVPGFVAAATRPKRRIYVIDDGGESYWWAAESEAEAVRLHHSEVGRHGDDPRPEYDVEELADDEELTIDLDLPGTPPVTKTAADWARESLDYKVPMIGCTCW
jgi:hypothetical protein